MTGGIYVSDSNEKLLRLLDNDCTVDFIKQEMGFTNSQLVYRLSLLKHMGYIVQSKYYGNGDIIVTRKNDSHYFDSFANIYTKSNENTIRFLVISDLHFFHEFESRVAIDNAFSYCIDNNIHILFICGDLIDCMKNNAVPLEEQVEKFTEIYPTADHVISFCVLGNHDFKPVERRGIDFKKVIENKRLDIVPVGYKEAGIRIKNDQLFLIHPIQNIGSMYKTEKANSLTFIGHSHTTKIEGRHVYVPSLSDVKVTSEKNFHFFPQALDVTLNFNLQNRSFSSAVIDQIIMEKSPYVVSEHTVCLTTPTPYKNNLEISEYPSLKKIK